MKFFRGKPDPVALSSLDIPNFDIARARRATQVAVIDDHSATKRIELLRAHGFAIQQISDPRTLEQLAPFDLLFIDIIGVGKHLSGAHQGAHLLAQIRAAYPEKYLIAYSGSQFAPDIQSFLSHADESIKKDADTETWVDALDRGCKAVAHPKESWLRLRRRLVDAGYEMTTLAELEQAYIRAVVVKDGNLLATNFKQIADAKQLNHLAQLGVALAGLLAKFVSPMP